MLNKLKNINWFWIIFGALALYKSINAVDVQDSYFWAGILLYSFAMNELASVKQEVKTLSLILGQLLKAFHGRLKK